MASYEELISWVKHFTFHIWIETFSRCIYEVLEKVSLNWKPSHRGEIKKRFKFLIWSDGEQDAFKLSLLSEMITTIARATIIKINR